MALTLGIIGAGHMGTLHAQNLLTDGRVHLIGVADVDQDRAETLARLVKGRAFASVEALLDTGVEVVYVCTPNTLHTAAVLAALQRHVHVFSEKPMATTIADATGHGYNGTTINGPTWMASGAPIDTVHVKPGIARPITGLGSPTP